MKAFCFLTNELVMSRFIATLIVLTATCMFVLIGLWFSPHAVGSIGYMFDMAHNASDATNLYVGLLIFVMFALLTVTVVLWKFGKPRIYSLLTISLLLALVFVVAFSANTIEYKGHTYIRLRNYPCHSNGIRTLSGKVVLQTYGDVDLVCNKQGMPVFFKYEGRVDKRVYDIWDLKGNLLFHPKDYIMIDYYNEWVYTISVEQYRRKGDYTVFFRLYDFEGNYIITRYYTGSSDDKWESPDNFDYIKIGEEGYNWESMKEEDLAGKGDA